MKPSKQELMDNMNFSEKEASIYLTLLEAGEVTATDLAKRCNLKRTTLYNMLPEMQRRGFIKVTKNKGRKFYFIDDVRNLEQSLEEKTEAVRQMIPELEKFHNISRVKPRIILYEGVIGMKRFYGDIITSVSSGDSILTYIGLQNFYDFVPKEILEKYVGERIRKRVVNKIIAHESDVARDWMNSAKNELREIKILKEQKEIFSGDFKIFANKVAFLSYDEDFFGVIVESKGIHNMMKGLFYAVWNEN
ncbi:MAG TPA: hypothetical protein DCS28_03935 [Candidatus Moranbacteria bacterium]|nr:hypothetical protein [Candidatus Moranbacteria bacterium]HAT75160.1 hypothetical protein [Candidatus Moranbacteria bacterium]